MIALTGATGYVGSRVVALARARGVPVVALGRRPLGLPGVADLPFDLAAPAPPPLPPGTRGLIHLAADTAGDALPPGAEESALRALCAALPEGAPLLFASSQSAAADAPSAYGRAKWRLEQEALAIGATPVRIALVVGGEERGLFGRLCAVLRRLPLRPVLLPQPLTQPVHVDDVAEALLRAALQPPPPAPLALAGAPLPFGALLARIARARGGKRAPALPVPLPLLLPALRLAERATGRVLGAAQLSALARTQPLPREDLPRLLGRPPRPPLGARFGPRRALLGEGALLLRHLAGGPVAPVLARRYAAILAAAGEGPLLRPALPAPLARAALWVLDGPGTGPLPARLLLALRVLEAAPGPAARFLGPAGAPDRPLAALAALALCGAAEALRRVAHALLGAPLRRVLCP